MGFPMKNVYDRWSRPSPSPTENLNLNRRFLILFFILPYLPWRWGSSTNEMPVTTQNPNRTGFTQRFVNWFSTWSFLQWFRFRSSPRPDSTPNTGSEAPRPDSTPNTGSEAPRPDSTPNTGSEVQTAGNYWLLVLPASNSSNARTEVEGNLKAALEDLLSQMEHPSIASNARMGTDSGTSEISLDPGAGENLPDPEARNENDLKKLLKNILTKMEKDEDNIRKTILQTPIQISRVEDAAAKKSWSWSWAAGLFLGFHRNYIAPTLGNVFGTMLLMWILKQYEIKAIEDKPKPC